MRCSTSNIPCWAYLPTKRPKIKSKKIKNMYYTGQLTVPGPGVPPSIISGQLVAEQIIKTK